MDKIFKHFIWSEEKELENIRKHGIDFFLATQVFKDNRRKIFVDEKHSLDEQRFFCVGKVNDCILTVRFVYRENRIRIFGAGYWRKGVKYYEEK